MHRLVLYAYIACHLALPGSSVLRYCPTCFRTSDMVLLSVLQLVPLARVKKMMKEVQDVKIVAADASWLVARATVSALTAVGRS